MKNVLLLILCLNVLTGCTIRKGVNSDYEGSLELLKAMNIKIDIVDTDRTRLFGTYDGGRAFLNYNREEVYIDTNSSVEHPFQHSVLNAGEWYLIYIDDNRTIEKKDKSYVTYKFNEIENTLKLLAMVDAYEQTNKESVYDSRSKGFDDLFYLYNGEMNDTYKTKEEFLESRDQYDDYLEKITVTKIYGNRVRINIQQVTYDSEADVDQDPYVTTNDIIEVTFNHSQEEFDKEYDNLVEIINESDNIIEETWNWNC